MFLLLMENKSYNTFRGCHSGIYKSHIQITNNTVAATTSIVMNNICENAGIFSIIGKTARTTTCGYTYDLMNLNSEEQIHILEYLMVNRLFHHYRSRLS